MADPMTTPDPTLAARLDAMLEPALQYDSAQDELHGALDTALRSGQLITLADHTAAVQAAVAKAVDELAPAIPHDNDCINFARYNSDECSCGRDVWIADIRARKEDTP